MHHMHMNYQHAIGLAIQNRRKAMKLTQPQLAERMGGLDQSGISRVERGLQGLSLESLEQFAIALETRPSVLQAEAEIMLEGAENGEATAFQITQMMGVRHVPLISWVEAGSFAEAVDSYARGTGEKLIKTQEKVGRLAYALRVHGHSMTNPRNELRSFPQGTIIVVDPHRGYESGSLIIARVDDQSETTFKEYREDAGVKMLVPLNPQYPSMIIDKPITFCGTVVSVAEYPV